MSRPTARSVAAEAVGRVIDDGAYSNRLVPALLARSGLDTRDRAFAMELTFGTLRRRRRLDAAIEGAANRPIERITPPEARHALRLGAYQLLDMDVPPHAAVSETVDLVAGRARGFVNAVLRRLAAAPPEIPDGSGAPAIAARTGLSPWMVEELASVLDEGTEEAAAALASKAPLTLRVVGGPDAVSAVIADLEAAGATATRGGLHPACVLVSGGDPRALPGFAEGRWTVQDQASAFVGEVLAPAVEAVGPSGVVVAGDVSARRALLIASSSARLGLSPRVVVQDATRPSARGPFDRVVVDAPCSGIGSARRRPELLWRVERSRLAGLAARQLAIATASADLVAPGGRLVYAVCTFTRAETDAVCDALLRARPALEAVATAGPDGDAERHRLWPHRHGCDGMFVAAFRRAS
jgi:16S rRNA (cytosine967-C5)-methyltransferase